MMSGKEGFTYLCILMLFLSFSISMRAQSYHPSVYKSQYRQSEDVLPYKVDNTKHKYFPGMFNQFGYSCNQASSIGYLFTYEINANRDVSASLVINRYPYLFPFNLLNEGSSSKGVSYYDSWEVIRTNGIPNLEDYGINIRDEHTWMSGYDKYYRGMKNRIEDDYTLFVGNPEGLETLKRWIYNHWGESDVGGLANFQIASGTMHIERIPDGTEEGGNHIVTHFGEYVGHAMTFVGFNDSVRYDFNGDSEYTNHMDISGDGLVDMRDWEIGALQYTNSWGEAPRSFVPYRLLAFTPKQGGIWNRSVQIIKIKDEYAPELCMKVRLKHNRRNSLKIFAGLSMDENAESPDFIYDFPFFNYQGGPYPMQGKYDTEEAETIEIGLDITPLIEKMDGSNTAKIFLMIDEKDEDSLGNGSMISYALIDYVERAEYSYPETKVQLNDNDLSLFPIAIPNHFSRPEIVNRQILLNDSLSIHEEYLVAENGTPPYRWSLSRDYEEQSMIQEFPDTDEQILMETPGDDAYENISLAFDFPFYGEKHNVIRIYKKGVLTFNNDYEIWPYAINKDLYTSMRKGIFPAGKRLIFKEENGDLVRIKNDTVFTVYWDCSFTDHDVVKDLKIAVQLHPDGEIKYYYAVEGNTFGDFDWDAGFSFGDGIRYFRSSVSDADIIFNNQCVSIKPERYPPGVELQEDGHLTINPAINQTLDFLEVALIDNRNIHQTKTIPISHREYTQNAILEQNYPNPFRNSTLIKYSILEKNQVVLSLYDLSGQRIAVLVDEEKDAGNYQFVFNSLHTYRLNLKPGVYFYGLQTGEQAQMKKMVLIHQ